jgi:hypothetical protein
MLRTSLLVIGSLLVLAGCSGGGDGHAAKTSTVSSSASKSHEPPAGIRGNDAGPHAGQAEGQLTIEITHVADKSAGAGIPVPTGIACDRQSPATCHGTVTCPADATDKDAAALCTWLAGSGREALTAKTPHDQVCTEQYGGPEVATVTGTIDGTRVDARFSRVNGCEIARFDAAQRLWGGDAANRPAEPDVISDPPEAFH